ncbi:hypothetical protein [Streptomyces natalensis]|uniref:Uncharacterized protein n=1 Tax=Streptomyces natalensis ATCC 27448 TaxID=1240678 RepID=A0A0D7CLE4_9ACTN|nr:hypothetical protein [Streptomyces natalensis]KIZ16901.1 hypothetical protein SNA_18185 [Streptomyces natalensis ATCC 27448]
MTSTLLTARDQSRAYSLLSQVAEAATDLPAAEVHVRGHINLSALVTIDLSFHGEPDAFDAWLRALDIAPAGVHTRRVEFGGWVSSTHTTIDGIAIVLTLHHRQDAPAMALAAAA